MSYSEPVSQVKRLKISDLYRDFIFSFVILLFLASLFASKSSLAAYSVSKNDTSYTVGFAYKQQIVNYSQAKYAFEKQNYTYSASLLTELAENGHIQAQYLLATQYDAGLGVAKNKATSFYWYKKAALAGADIAQHNVAVAYAQGQGVKQNLKNAIVWWKRAARAGNTDSQYNLGIIYAAGRQSVRKNLPEALKWWSMAANSGDAMAQFNLGALYANGFGVTSRTCEASRWWKKSAANGFAQAELALAVLEDKQGYKACH